MTISSVYREGVSNGDCKSELRQGVQDAQEYGSTDEMMVSRVFFSVEVKREPGQVEKHGDLHANLRQAVGRFVRRWSD